MKIYDFRIEYREQPKGLAVKIPPAFHGRSHQVTTMWCRQHGI